MRAAVRWWARCLVVVAAVAVLFALADRVVAVLVGILLRGLH